MAETPERFDEHVKQYKAEEEPKLLEKFRAEIMALKAAEATSEGPEGHFSGKERFDPKYLGVREMTLWRQINQGALPEGESDAYRTELFLESGEYAETDEEKFSAETRLLFLGLALNKAMALSYKKEKT